MEGIEGKKQAELTSEERKRLVDVFAWLITEDKKQNPELYKNGFSN